MINENGRTCTQCGEYKPWEKFSAKNKGRSINNKAAYCKDCGAKRNKDWKKTNAGTDARANIRALIKLGGKCHKCGENDLNLLDVDHINGDGGGKNRPHPSIKCRSIINHGSQDKYQLLCANCHKEKTRVQMGYQDKNELAKAMGFHISTWI